jgi:hypothetical protein
LSTIALPYTKPGRGWIQDFEKKSGLGKGFHGSQTFPLWQRAMLG